MYYGDLYKSNSHKAVSKRVLKAQKPKVGYLNADGYITLVIVIKPQTAEHQSKCPLLRFARAQLEPGGRSLQSDKIGVCKVTRLRKTHLRV